MLGLKRGPKNVRSKKFLHQAPLQVFVNGPLIKFESIHSQENGMFGGCHVTEKKCVTGEASQLEQKLVPAAQNQRVI